MTVAASLAHADHDRHSPRDATLVVTPSSQKQSQQQPSPSPPWHPHPHLKQQRASGGHHYNYATAANVGNGTIGTASADVHLDVAEREPGTQTRAVTVDQRTPSLPKPHIAYERVATGSTRHKQSASRQEGDEGGPVVFGIHLDRFSSTVQYLILAGCLFAVYLTSGLAQEALFSKFPGFRFGFFLTFIHYSLNAFFAGRQFRRELKDVLPTTVSSSKGEEKRFFGLRLPWWLAVESRAPMRIYVLTAVVGVMGYSLGNEALAYLNYPTKTLMKSSKLLFIMAFGRIVLGKHYSQWDYFASLQLIMGLVMLYLANVSVSISFHPYGLGLMTTSLVCDAVTGNLNEKILQYHGSTATEMIFYVNLFGSVIAVAISILTNKFFSAISFCFSNPLVIVFIMATSCLSFIGSNFVHNLTRQFGIVIMSTTATLRKCCSILLSFLIFPKPFVFGHFIAIVLVFSGVLSRISAQSHERISRILMMVWARIKQRTRYRS